MDKQPQKLIGVNERLGANLVAKGQPTQRVIYDQDTQTIPAGGTATYRFFSETANKPLAESNLQEGFLDNGESLVIKSLNFVDDNENLRTGALGVFSVIVGNQEVVKKLPLTIFNAVENLHIENFVNGSLAPSGSGNLWSARMLTDIVVPPETTFEVQLKVYSASLVSDAVLKCSIQGLGVLFNPNTAL